MKFYFLLFCIVFLATVWFLSGSSFHQTSVHAATTHVVISEIHVAGNTANDEFVELYNPTMTAIDLTGWKLRKESSNGATTSANLVTTMSGILSAHGFFLITSPESSASGSADLLYSSSSNRIASNNTVLLFDSANVLVDKVGMGSALDVEGTAATEPANSGSIERKANSTSTMTSMTTGEDVLAGNGEDTDNNAIDFIVRAVSDPQNSRSAIEPPVLTPTTSSTPTVTMTVTPSVTDSPTPTLSPSPTLTSSPTPSPSSIPSPTPSATPTLLPTATITMTPSPTLSLTPTVSLSPSPSSTPTINPTEMPTATEKPTLSPTVSPTMSPTISMQTTPTITPTPHRSFFSCSWRIKRFSFGWLHFSFPVFHCEMQRVHLHH